MCMPLIREFSLTHILNFHMQLSITVFYTIFFHCPVYSWANTMLFLLGLKEAL